MKKITIGDIKKFYITKLGIDVHGVMDDDPEQVKSMLKQFMDVGIEIYVISGPPSPQVKEELDNLGYIEGIHYTTIITIVDFLKTQPETDMWFSEETQSWWTTDENWWSAKAKICKQYDIDLMLDNTDKYKPYFDKIKTKTIFWLYES